MLPRRRRQSGSGAAHTNSVFPTMREAATEEAPPTHHGGWGTRATRRGSHRNSVHKCPKTAPRGHFRRSVYTPAFPRLSTTAQQCTRMAQNDSERPFSPICVHSFAPTTARATGRGHGSHDIDGLMAPAIPGCSDLRPRRRGGDTTSYPHELTKPLFLVCCRRRRAIWTRRSRAPRSSRR